MGEYDGKLLFLVNGSCSTSLKSSYLLLLQYDGQGSGSTFRVYHDLLKYAIYDETEH